MDGKNGNGHRPDDLLNFKLEGFADESETWPQCPSCGIPTGGENRYCGKCGTENPGFNLEEFRKQFGAKSLEDIQAEQQCESGHGPALSDPYRSAECCIFCGKQYKE